MKMIKVSDQVHERLKEDKKEFSRLIGIPFSFNDTIIEYLKILNTVRKNE